MQTTALTFGSIFRLTPTFPRMRHLQSKNSGSMRSNSLSLRLKFAQFFSSAYLFEENVAHHAVCCVQEKNLGLVSRNRRDGQHPLGPGRMPSSELGYLLLLHLERSQEFRKGQLTDDSSQDRRTDFISRPECTILPMSTQMYYLQYFILCMFLRSLRSCTSQLHFLI